MPGGRCPLPALLPGRQGHEAAPAWRGAAGAAWTGARGGGAGAGPGFRSAAQPAGPRRWGAGDAWWAQGRGAGPGGGCRSAAGAGAQGPGGAEAAWARRGLGAEAARARGRIGAGRRGAEGRGAGEAGRKLGGAEEVLGLGRSAEAAWALGGPGGGAGRAGCPSAGEGRGWGAQWWSRGEEYPAGRGAPGQPGTQAARGAARPLGTPGRAEAAPERGGDVGRRGEGLTRGRGCRAVLQLRGGGTCLECRAVSAGLELRAGRLETTPPPGPARGRPRAQAHLAARCPRRAGRQTMPGESGRPLVLSLPALLARLRLARAGGSPRFARARSPPTPQLPRCASPVPLGAGELDVPGAGGDGGLSSWEAGEV